MTPETTTAVSFGGAALVAVLPKIIDLILGARIAQRKDDDERRAAYEKAVWDDATLVRQERAKLVEDLTKRNDELERRNDELEERFRNLQDEMLRMRGVLPLIPPTSKETGP